jgi:hypothetical protein
VRAHNALAGQISALPIDRRQELALRAAAQLPANEAAVIAARYTLDGCDERTFAEIGATALKGRSGAWAQLLGEASARTHAADAERGAVVVERGAYCGLDLASWCVAHERTPAGARGAYWQPVREDMAPSATCRQAKR